MFPPGFLLSLTLTIPPERLATSMQSEFAQLNELLRQSSGDALDDPAVNDRMPLLPQFNELTITRQI